MQGVELSFIKNFELKASTIATLKQDDLILTHRDLITSARSMSDLITFDELIEEQFLERSGSLVKNGPGYSRNPKNAIYDIDQNGKVILQRQRKMNYKNAAWYIAPQSTDHPDFQQFVRADNNRDLISEGIDLCALSIPLQGKVLSAPYTNSFSFKGYMAFENTALFCNVPLEFAGFYVAPMTDKDYQCPAAELPLEYPNWNEKFYSPVCRGWYTQQRSNPTHSTQTNLYLFADKISNVGIT